MYKECIDIGKDCFEGERIDDIGFGHLMLIQKPKEFCYGVDAVILADFAARDCKIKPQKIVDLGTGSGVIPLILSHKTDAKEIIGVELQRASYDRALRSAELNSLEKRISYINEDVKNIGVTWGKDLKECIDVVVSNPPYFRAGGAIVSNGNAKAIARHEITANLKDFLKCAEYLLKPMGELFMVHRPSRLTDICCFGREVGLELKELCMVSPKKDEVPNIVLLRMVKGGGRELKVLPPIAVYDDDGNYTEKLLAAYKERQVAL